jgi:hypothetical protein
MATAKPIKSDERDQRVRDLLTLNSLDNRINLLFGWVKVGQVDLKTFNDLVKIATSQANLQEVARDLRLVVKKYCGRHPDIKVEQNSFASLCAVLPGLASKLESVAGDA